MLPIAFALRNDFFDVIDVLIAHGSNLEDINEVSGLL